MAGAAYLCPLAMRQAPGRDHYPADAVPHSGKQDPGLGVEALAICQQILLKREFDILERELHPAHDLANLVALRALP
jgi:hypothetical protein